MLVTFQQRQHSPRVAACVALFCLVLLCSSAFGQGFMVKPMRLDLPVAAGRTIEMPIEIRNTAADGPRQIDLRLVELTQSPDGGWHLLEPEAGKGVSNPYSSIPWTSLPETSVMIDRLQPAEVMVRVDVPSSARGYYFAGLLAETPAPENADGIAVRVRFLIPLIVEISGRPVRQQVVLADTVMTYDDGADSGTATTTAQMVIANEGRTFSRIDGTLVVDRLNGDLWRPVTRVELLERSILPGVTLVLGDDLKRRLPSGTYRLRGELSVDGRRVPPLIKEIEFVGDPSTDSLAYDTALILEPGEVSMQVVPGATRTTTVSIENPGTDPVVVSMASSTPRSLSGVELGQVRGTDLSAQPWTEIKPNKFTIRPGRRQSVRVISRIPKEALHYPNYYAELVLSGTYADGQSAGDTRSTLHLTNGQAESSENGVVEVLTLAEGASAASYIVQARFTNVGDIHLEPKGRALLLTPQGARVRNVELTGEEGMLLPLGKRTYSAEIDLGDLAPGYYALRAVYALGGGKDVVRQQVILVETQELVAEDGTKTIVPLVTIDPEAPEFQEGVEISPEAATTLEGDPPAAAGLN